MPDPLILVVMGVSGAGKTTISKLLAAALRCPLLEGDDLHPPLNVEKMHHGVALTDADRRPWLDKIAAAIDDWRARGQSGVVACSASSDPIATSSSATGRRSGWSISRDRGS